jgi:hypothetical protein
MTTKRNETVSKLVEQTLNSESQLKASELLRSAARIARLMGDYRNLAWLERELISFDAELAKSDLGVELHNYLPDQEAIRRFWDKDSQHLLEERRIHSYDKNGNPATEMAVFPMSIPDVEQAIEGLILEREASMQIPNGVMPGHIATYHQQLEQKRVLFTLHINDYRAILNRVRQRTLKYLNQTEAFITYEEASADVFESAKKSVESELAAIAPDVLTKFTAAQERLSDGSTEAYSHALETCRRVLKTFADSVYPPTSRPVVSKGGKTRVLDDEHYIARLWQYLYDLMGNHTSPNITLAVLEHLGDRIDKVYSLTCKGVHDDVVEYEAKQCVIQTFLTISDILAFRKASVSAVSTQ